LALADWFPGLRAINEDKAVAAAVVALDNYSVRTAAVGPAVLVVVDREAELEVALAEAVEEAECLPAAGDWAVKP
jgi:hypothetical protein